MVKQSDSMETVLRTTLAFLKKEASDRGGGIEEALKNLMELEASEPVSFSEMHATPSQSPPMASSIRLGRRECEVLQHLAKGHTSTEIAKRMFICASTVEVHRRNIRQKLDLHSIAELTRYAIRNGLASE